MPRLPRVHWLQSIGWRLSLFALLVCLFFLFRAIIVEKKIAGREADQIRTLTDEVAILEKENQRLIGDIDYLQSDVFVEREAREKLNFKKQGEKVVVITGRENGVEAESASSPGKKNWQLWREYLFGYLFADL